MLWMKSYLFYCSVRLGVMVVALLTLAQSFIPAVFLLVQGINLLDLIVDLLQNDDYYKKHFLISKLLNWINHDPKSFIIIINFFLFLHIGTCLLAIYGAFKLSKYFLFPFMGLEFIRVITCLTFHIILMIILKKIINLGVLVLCTLLGGFIILYLGYNWCACVAFLQILNLIRTKRYRELYGDDPFSPQIALSYDNSNRFSYGTIENVHVITTPTGSDIDELKRRNNSEIKVDLKNQRNRQIIAVLPSSKQFQPYPNMMGKNFGDAQPQGKWWLHSKTDTSSKPFNFKNQISVTYNNWQWSELVGGRGRRQSKLIGADWYQK